MNLHEIKIFEGMEADVVTQIEEHCVAGLYEKDVKIFEKGSPAKYLYILDEGNVELLLKAKDKIICTLVLPGELFGWSAMVENGIYTASCISMVPTKTLRISRENIEKIFDRHPNAALMFYRRLGAIFSKRISKVVDV